MEYQKPPIDDGISKNKKFAMDHRTIEQLLFKQLKQLCVITQAVVVHNLDKDTAKHI